jgi:GWxTD domain-containing protein
MVPFVGRAQQAPSQTVDPAAPVDSVLATGQRALAAGDTARALTLWGRRFEAQREAGAADLRLADASLQGLLRAGGDTQDARAARAYTAILRQAGPGLDAEAAAIVRRHLAQLAPLLPTTVRDRVLRGASVQEAAFAPAAGTTLVRWWRRQDPLPATARNERLIEHLQRVSHAHTHFACTDPECEPTGWDARGTVYVRFGAPSRRQSVAFNDTEFNRDVFRFGVPVSRHDFPDNELWVYPQIDRTGKYLFVKEDGYYQLSPTKELLPPQLRGGYGGRSERTLNKAVSAIAALEHIYERLSQSHISYAQRYSTIANYAGWQEEQARLIDMGAMSRSRSRTVGSGVGQRKTVGPGPGPASGYPNEFVSNHLHQSASRDAQDAKRRAQRMPAAHSTVRDGTERLPVAVRAARFLSEAGRTAVRVAWSHPPDALALSDATERALNDAGFSDPAGYLVRLRAVQQDTTFRRGDTFGQRYFVARGTDGRRAPVDVQTFTMTGDTDPFHIGLQWDQRVALSREAGRIRRGPLTKRAVYRIDSLAALPDSTAGLVMSDVMPGRLPSDAAPRRDAMTPYPFATLDDDAALALYFELYHLQKDGEGQTKYTVEYRVERVTDKSGLRGVFGGDERSQTVMRSTYKGDRSRTEEFISLDLDAWDLTAEGMLAVTVRVTDEHRGQQVQRTLTFQDAREGR